MTLFNVEYLLYGTWPTVESYSNVAGPPDMVKMNLVPAEEATRYVHLLIEFEIRNPDFFIYGKFIDQERIDITGKDSVAKGFVNGKSIGVVVWNKNKESKSEFSISIPGYQIKNAMEPQN